VRRDITHPHPGSWRAACPRLLATKVDDLRDERCGEGLLLFLQWADEVAARGELGPTQWPVGLQGAGHSEYRVRVAQHAHELLQPPCTEVNGVPGRLFEEIGERLQQLTLSLHLRVMHPAFFVSHCPFPVLAPWQSYGVVKSQSDCQFDSAQNSWGSPRCGTM